MQTPAKDEVTLEPIRHEFFSDKRIAELFPDPQLAEYVQMVRDTFRVRYEQWQLGTYGASSEQ